MSRLQDRELVVGITPFEEPNAALVVALARAGSVGVLDVGRNQVQAHAALADVCRWWSGKFGVRLPTGCPLSPADLPEQVDVVVHGVGSPWAPAPGRRVFIEVTSVAEAHTAIQAGAAGLIAKGAEAGGRVGITTTFVLLQQLLADPLIDVPVWAAGGIGPHTAAAAIAGGAAGVVLDAQLALVTEADLPADVAAAIRVMDGTETAVIADHRLFTRPDLPVVDPESVASRLGARNLGALPIGQDGALAGPLARRYVTAGGVVAAVRTAITEGLRGGQLQSARGWRPLVVQGPMTRVSDQAEFAAAVASAGGLPFLALAMSDGEQTRDLLTHTAALLGTRPWGVGILGFVPPDIRQAQLATVHEVCPPYALIAGGRPAQAASLEAAGIKTFLHVPSPNLLDRFLTEGVRRFVFEGQECGGHIGRLASFPLWETQLQRLLDYDNAHGCADQLQVLFAGGIHDERSAAMVAALAAPLAERGSQTGILMGTAYLFTQEAVAAGAIAPGYQQAALACAGTVLLETAPGHAIRCSETPYVRTFAETKARLVDAGVPREQMWTELEQLNMGRLRIASKGLRRNGDALVAVNEEVQHREGMIMLGDVATLRTATTTIEALHAEVTEAAARFVAARANELGIEPLCDGQPAQSKARPLDVAIIGMAGVFPGAPDLAMYWANVLAGVDAVTEVPTERWDPAVYSGLARWGGFLPDIPFDPLTYGIPPAALASIDPIQLLSLEVAARALRDAGYEQREFDREHTSVIFGAEGGTDLGNAYAFRSMYPAYHGKLPGALDEQLPSLTEDSFPGVLPNVVAGRIANRLDLGGTNYTVSAACASALAAVNLACKELRAGTSNMVLAGGAELNNSIHHYRMFASVQALSPTGRCRPFDSTADGIALGEGVACVVLKRLADAERDGDRIYAVIKGIGSASDGRSRGLTAPRPEGQRRALERAYQMAGISPAEVGLVEAHGTGTVVGDRTELAVLTELFTTAGAPAGSCALGSVKSQIGHTRCTAGLAGLIKAARAVYTGVRPPTGQLRDPNPYWDGETSPFFFEVAAQPWVTPGRRVAAVSAFGFGGTNFHAVLTSYDAAPQPRHGLDAWPAELFLFTGPDRVTAIAKMDQLIEFLASNDAAGQTWRMRDLARNLAEEAGRKRVWAAVVAHDVDDLTAKLAAARAGTPADGVFVASEDANTAGQVAFLFPGQGSQRPGMLADLFVAFPRLRRFLEPGGRCAGAMFPPAAFSKENSARQRAALTDTRVAQPALGIAGLAMHELLTSLGVQPDHLGGHSYGELIALAAAGAVGVNDLLELSRARGQSIVAAAGSDPGTMAAVSATAEQVRAVLGDGPVVIANHNAPDQVVISGPTSAVEAALGRLAEVGLTGSRIPVACAFHSPVVAAATRTFAVELDRHAVGSPRLPVWSNTTAAPYPSDPAAIRAALAAHVAEPVRFVEQVEVMYAAGVRVFIEAGPGRVLTRMVDAILADRPHTSVATDVVGEHGLRRLLLALGELAVAGVPVDPAELFRGRDNHPASAPMMAPSSGSAAARRAGWVMNGHLVKTADGRCLQGGLHPARQVMAPITEPDPQAAGADGREATVLEFLRSTRELVAAQREIMLGYLGASAAAPAGIPVPTLPPAAVLPLTTALPPPVPSAPSKGTAVSAPRKPAQPGESAQLTPNAVLATVRSLVSDRTGYPVDMLEADLDLEADLSIDSIKRTELVGLLTDRLGLTCGDGTLDDSVAEELTRLRTLRGIVDWIVNRTDPSPASPVQVTPVQVGATQQTRRYLVEAISSAAPVAPPGLSLSGRRVTIVGDGASIALELSVLLEQHGAAVRLLGPDQVAQTASTDALIYLAALDRGRSAVLPDGFATLRNAVLGGLSQLLVITGSGGQFAHGPSPNGVASIGLAGLVRTIAREFPDRFIRVIDLDPKEEPVHLARCLLAELLTRNTPTAVGYAAGERVTLQLAAAPLESSAPVGIGLGPESVVLLTGGARGITARVAVGLARASGCHLELVGRTPLPDGDEEPMIAAAADRVALRRVLAQAGNATTAEIEAATGRILAVRQIRATLAQLSELAASVRYSAVDVRDSASVTAMVNDVYRRHGRLDGIVHGAGVLADRLLVDKTSDEFTRVWETKVNGARALAEAARGDLGFLVLFGSVSGIFGNRGQADYSAANDALDTLARIWAPRACGRVVAVDWGPWAASDEGTGMVSAELQREYARRGIGLIEPEDGVACLLAELAGGTESQVVYLCADPAAFQVGAFGAGQDG
jgi:acyl transferase domain-containing protein/NAD(P)H-dependent flavin oxidoreductase YrpB (nitropropane dioxygenase family)/NAD(P)-dependent dehydrogenase (short-subunit alcohol dehydrogenase family)/acyl carrier protein